MFGKTKFHTKTLAEIKRDEELRIESVKLALQTKPKDCTELLDCADRIFYFLNDLWHDSDPLIIERRQYRKKAND